MRNQTIILIGYDIAISHSIYIESLSSHRGIEIIKANEKQFKEEPLVFPIRNYDLNFLDPLIDYQEPRIKRALWFQGSEK